MKIPNAMILLLSFFLFSCGGGSDNVKEQSNPVDVETQKAQATSPKEAKNKKDLSLKENNLNPIVNDKINEVKKQASLQKDVQAYGGPQVLAKIQQAKQYGARVLYLEKSQISDITPLAELNNLTKLVLTDNQIKDLTPLKGLTSLKDLRLENNQISDVSPLAGLVNLEDLRLQGNQIKTLDSLKKLTGLYWLRLTGNPLPESQKDMICNALPEVDVRFEPDPF